MCRRHLHTGSQVISEREGERALAVEFAVAYLALLVAFEAI